MDAGNGELEDKGSLSVTNQYRPGSEMQLKCASLNKCSQGKSLFSNRVYPGYQKVMGQFNKYVFIN